MELTSGGTAIMLALAAGLWFLYLVPTWARRREYLADERATARLQRLHEAARAAEAASAERAAGPVSVTTTREALRAERTLRARQRRADAMVDTPGAIRRRRMRRTRVLASVLMIGATAVAAVQLWLMATTGVTLGAWLVLAATLAAGGVAVAVQRRLDARAMPRGSAPAGRRAVGSGIPAVLLEGAPVRPADPAPWTPVAVPPPLYGARPAVQRVRPAPDAALLLRQAAAAEAEAQRAVRPPAEVTPLRAERPASRWAAMGVLDPAEASTPDLDEVLRRRRSAG